MSVRRELGTVMRVETLLQKSGLLRLLRIDCSSVHGVAAGITVDNIELDVNRNLNIENIFL